ncbi:hypothetical protein TVAG_385570 [Trichomonas vaginalis G3]|uniref:Uncharacterized protein n=1 Tax=Trichomonas vaginalis (strain ATCC PRA-98 / G3) TaxID=412133 RepID=A2FU10_TRIV3|nr:A-type inclusion protein-related family [Trichomonas vaginalis G3]EAX91605.1 hypothetical protein TVAG_385570 [Trichomonas vaginalis G3]KAI5517293.1 A-type inclusion protein-related family [Trichomonas vaginalis G3]|eukprot:XP_001304535.1 hypothetical protein [Trichomonas vaginalis G3]
MFNDGNSLSSSDKFRKNKISPDNYSFALDTEVELSSNQDLHSDFEKIINENQTLTESIASYKVDLQNTQKLLQIEKRKTAELEQQLRNEKDAKDASIFKSLSAAQSNDEQKKQIETLKNQNSKLTKSLNEKNTEIINNVNAISAFVNQWNRFFSTNYSNLQEIEREIPSLFRSLNTEKKDSNELQSNSTIQQVSDENIQLRRQIEDLQKQLQSSITQANESKKDFVNKLDKLANDNSNKISDLQEKLGVSSIENSNLRSTNENLNKRIEALQQLLDDKTEIQKMEEIINGLKDENTDLKNKLKSFKSKAEHLVSKIQESDDLTNQVNEELVNAKKSLAQSQKDLKSSNDQLERQKYELEEIKNTLETEKKQNSIKDQMIKELTQKQLADADEIDDLSRQIKLLNIKVEELTHNNEKSEQTINSMHQDNDKLIENLQKEKENSSKLNSVLKDTEAHNNALKDENQKLSDELSKIKPEIIPICAWTNFGPQNELKQQIQQIVTCKDKHLPQKICESLYTVSKFYESQLSALNANLEVEMCKSDLLCSLMSEINSFLKLPQKTPNEVISYKSDFLSNIKKELGKVNQHIIELEVFSKEFDKSKDYKEIGKRADQLQNLNDELNKEIIMKENDISRLLQQNKSMNDEIIRLKSEIDQNEQELESNKALADKVSELTKTVYEQKVLLQAAGQKIALQSNAKSLEDKKNKESLDFHAKLAERKYEKEKKLYELKIKEMEEMNAELESTVENLSKSLKRKKDINKKLKSEIARLLSAQNNKEIETPPVNDESNNSLVNELKHKIERLSKVNEGLQLEITQQMQKLTGQTTMIKRLQKQIKNSDEEKEMLNTMYNDMKQRYNNDTKHIQTKYEAENMSISEKFTHDIDAMKVQHESELRNIFGMIGTSFKQFYDARSKLDMQKTREIIDQASSQLNKLRNSDIHLRSLLGLEENDSIEDVVTNILFRQ